VHTPSSKRPVPPKLPKARAAALIEGVAAALIESVADVAAAASVTLDRAIIGADTEQRRHRAASGLSRPSFRERKQQR